MKDQFTRFWSQTWVTDNGQPGEPADWIKKNGQRLEHWGENDKVHQEMIADMKNRHRWARNIPPPFAPKRSDPNQPSFNPADILSGMDDEDLDEI